MKIYFIILLTLVRLISAENDLKTLFLNAIDVEMKYRVNSRKLDLFILDLLKYRELGMKYDEEYLNIIISIRHFKDNLKQMNELILKGNADLTNAINENLSKFPAEFKSLISEEETKTSRKALRNKKRKMRRMKNKRTKRQHQSPPTREAPNTGAGPSFRLFEHSNEESDNDECSSDESEEGTERCAELQEAEQSEASEQPQSMETDVPEGVPEPEVEDQELLAVMNRYEFVDEASLRRKLKLPQPSDAPSLPLFGHTSAVDFEVLTLHRKALQIQRRHFESDLDTKFLLLIMYYAETNQVPIDQLYQLNLERMSLKGQIHSKITHLYVNATKFSPGLFNSERLKLRDETALMLFDYRGLIAKYEETIDGLD